MADLRLRALRKAARLVGGPERLRAVLDAPPGAFARWCEGAEALPTPVFLMLLEFLADMESGVNIVAATDTVPSRMQ
jgi:hypothetical protein